MHMVNPKYITADVVEATEFLPYSRSFNVQAVPTIIINSSIRIEGSMPEATFVEQVKKAAGVE